jgi:hypothetical protein
MSEITIGNPWEPYSEAWGRGLRVHDHLYQLRVEMPDNRDAIIELCVSAGSYDVEAERFEPGEAVELATRLLEAAEFKRQYDEQRTWSLTPKGEALLNAYQDPSTNPHAGLAQDDLEQIALDEHDRMRAQDNGYPTNWIPTDEENFLAPQISAAESKLREAVMEYSRWMNERYPS